MERGGRRGRKGRLLPVFALCLLILLCSGCKKKEEPSVPQAGVYQIYYLNSARTKLVSVDYATKTKDQEKLIGELAGQLLKAPADPDYQDVLGDKVTILDMKKEDNVLYLNFSKEYTAMKPTREILCRAACAKTFTQVPGVDYISISCAGQPLLDRSGSPVGAFSGADFVEGISDVNTYERVELKLYFANGTKDGLVPETREVVHNNNTSIEKLVVEQLIAGPQTAGDGPVLPKDTKLLNVSLTDNICYVNFDSSFGSGDLEAAEYIPIYAIVDSLTELQTVNKVQITVNGSSNVLYRDAISLADPFVRDEKYIVSK